MSQNSMILHVEALTDKVSYVEHVKRDTVPHYLGMTYSVKNVLPGSMAGLYIYFFNSIQ